MKTITIPVEQRKRTTIASNLYYDTIQIHDNKVVGYLNGKETMTWLFKSYSGIDFVKANINSQFAQIVFLTGINSKNREVGLDFGSLQNQNAMNDTNRILFCSGMFSFAKTNAFAETIADQIREAYNQYQTTAEAVNAVPTGISVADELKKYKELLDSGIITQEEFDAKKKQLLGL